MTKSGKHSSAKDRNAGKNPPNRGGKGVTRQDKINKSVGADWIESLVKISMTSSETTSSGGSTPLLSKAKRKEKRAEKKTRRDVRKQQQYYFATVGGKHQSVQPEKEALPLFKKKKLDTRKHLTILSDKVENLVKKHKKINNPKSRSDKRSNASLYVSPDLSIKGKAVSKHQITEKNVQPRKSDYGGLGLARSSLYLSLRDPSFIPKLQDEFSEHVKGFFGKQKTKAMKKQLDGNMLWRTLAESKSSKINSEILNKKVNGRKLSDMSGDERVEAMIQAGLV